MSGGGTAATATRTRTFFLDQDLSLDSSMVQKPRMTSPSLRASASLWNASAPRIPSTPAEPWYAALAKTAARLRSPPAHTISDRYTSTAASSRHPTLTLRSWGMVWALGRGERQWALSLNAR